MADSKSQPNRLRSLRDSVKKITKRLSDGEGEMIHKNSEQARELDKLRVQIQSMEEEIRRLYQSRYQLDQATKQNEKLVTTLQEAKAQIDAELRQARAELRRTAADLAIQAAGKLLAKNLDEPSQRKLVEDHLEYLDRLPPGSASVSN